MVTEESPVLADIRECFLKPYTESDIRQWPECEEKRRAQNEDVDSDSSDMD